MPRRHDNARRAEETGVGKKLNRYDWSDEELERVIADLLEDTVMKSRLIENAKKMQAFAGAKRAAEAILKVAG
ncbi:hypothetical protein [Rhizobium glycinendophyticum]|uniref:Glycosyl transferase family 28 C-terminal domain-containing protein n=1 Tax=Rhizobium glycinendophyticum TaxID=2589807 RepID=A0A504TPJ9_9HYPH|nr:hypothetical protein [Rhizobium glycinendophyticum]TPP04658.1 hypothetical protein FJQ55_22370 [Rhizobium glycinendophyticum]